MENLDIVHYPQDEMTTMLLPVTRGCPYNQCAFCSMYKDIRHSEVSVSEIETILLHSYKYTEKIFLTGADPLVIGFDKLKNILELIKKHLPYCARVASYAAIKTINRYTVEELSILHDAGLRLLYIGFESGSDDVLRLINKGHRTQDAIQAAQRLNEAHLQFNTIVMIGVAGKGKGVENALATAKMINQFSTNSIILMNLMIFEGTKMSDMVKEGDFVLADAKERLFEIKTLIENLEPQKPTIFDTTHPSNLVKIKGVLPVDKEELLRQLE